MTLRVPAAVQERLLDVLALDTEVLAIKRAMRDANGAIAAFDSDAEFLALVREAEDQATILDDHRLTVTHREADVQVARDRIERDRNLEKSITDSKDLVALEHEIESLERRIDKLRDEVAEATKARDEATVIYEATARQRDEFFATRATAVAQLNDQIAAHERRLKDIETARSVIVAELPGELVELYEKQRERYGVGASFLQRGITSASGFALTPGQIQEVRSADPDDVLICPDSNAILIRTAESGL